MSSSLKGRRIMASDEELKEFATELFQETLNVADESGEYKETAFFRQQTDLLIDAGEIPDAEYVGYLSPNRQSRVDGFCGDPIDGAQPDEPLTLGLIVTDFKQDEEVATLTQTEMNSLFNRLLVFVDAALKPEWRNKLEPSSREYELADLIATRWPRITKLRLYLLTNKRLSKRVEGKEGGTFHKKCSVTYSVIDIQYLMELYHSAGERPLLQVRFDKGNELGLHPLKALLASNPEAADLVYLAVLNGEDLAKIYNKWGTRLLEQNVRVFLQARSAVNKGIRNTLEYQPERFFSFNNGLTATAEGIKTTSDGNYILSLDNLQIVNGGQTTASIDAAYRAGKDLSKVFVQMKLNIIRPEEVEEIVPLISRYANSQNKVSESDLFSNHPFHIRVEEFSRRVFAPQQEGTFRRTKWFYERARGQYGDALSRPTFAGLSVTAARKQFKSEYPKSQMFSKTDLAKYMRVWDEDAYRVNLGAQKNFREFAEVITKKWSDDDTQFNEEWYKSLIAKKIIFNSTENIISKSAWYETGGYRGPLVVLTIGRIAEEVRKLNLEVDFQRIWTQQSLDAVWVDMIGKVAYAVNEVLMNPGRGFRNVSEWAKKQACWDEVRALNIPWSTTWLSELIDPSTVHSRNRESAKIQKQDNKMEATARIIKKGAEFWKDVSRWLVSENEGSEKERGCVNVAANLPTMVPSDKQSAVIVKLMERIERDGCPYRL